MSMPVTIQHHGPEELWMSTAPLPYTINPWDLFLSDLILFARHAWSLPCIVWPITPCNSGPLDELYPSLANIRDITVHLVLSLVQLAFLVSIPFCMFFPVPFSAVVSYTCGFITVNYILCKVLLNGWKPTLDSKVDLSHIKDKHEDEKWIFLNGVAVGQHWLQSNIDRIALTFGRDVLGIHNPTAGIVFDVVQCLMQRDFSYVTEDIRNGYAVLKTALKDPKHKKVIFIIHSQGGIEGGLILDWLFAEVSRELMEKLEIYTFGNAANHFNNPINVAASDDADNADKSSNVPSSSKTVKHIEHYCNNYDFVSRWGALHFASDGTDRGRTNRYAGRVFERHGKGHQFNQHYLDTMFPLENGPNQPGASEKNPFMDSEVQITESLQKNENSKPESSNNVSKKSPKSPIQKVNVRNLTFPLRQPTFSLLSRTTRPSTRKVSEYSRLWQYRNGMSPKD